MRIVPSHEHNVLAQRKRQTFRMTLTARSIGRRRIRFAGLPQTGQKTGRGSPTATRSWTSSAVSFSLRDFMNAGGRVPARFRSPKFGTLAKRRKLQPMERMRSRSGELDVTARFA